MAHQPPPPHMGGGGSGHYYSPAPSSKPRARTHDELDLDLGGLRDEEEDHDVDQHYQHLPPPHHSHPHQHPQHTQHTHHHHLPEQPPTKMARTGPLNLGPNQGMGMGMPGPSNLAAPSTAQQMPSPARRPRIPKLKFTQQDDQRLVDLKENKAMTWKQIAEYFPGRSSGTLQVRYCTKLKAKTTQWTDDTVLRLKNAIQEYEQDRWRMIAAKVGNGFSAEACREKAKEFREAVQEQQQQQQQQQSPPQPQPQPQPN